MSPKVLTASLFEFALIAIGWLLIWRLWFSPKITADQRQPRLAQWDISSTGFSLAALVVFFGWFAAQILGGQLPRLFPNLKTDETLAVIVGGSFGQLCLIASAFAARGFLRKNEPFYSSLRSTHTPSGGPNFVILAGVVTCIITIAVVYPAELLWERVLTWCHLPTSKQEMVEIFFRTASPLRLLGLSVMAVVLAPIAEEMTFRAGLFRYLRGRVPRWAALLVPALFFAALHVDHSTLKGLVTVAPLTCLGITFSLAYERTGKISVPIVAHALFNLHTVLFILMGVHD
jgi:membrane protease YdiL (CAAX protease family)